MKTLLKSLIEARALQTLYPSSKQASAHFTYLWHAFRMRFPTVRSGRLESAVNSLSTHWITVGYTRSIRRAKLHASNRVMRHEVARMLSESAFLSYGGGR